jgi:hypothetical protein
VRNVPKKVYLILNAWLYSTSPSRRAKEAYVGINMAEAQPPTIVEGATTGDVEDEIPQAAKSADDRKAAAALSSLDAREDDTSTGKNVDQEAVRKAMNRLAGTSDTTGEKKKAEEKKEVKKAIKVDQADVALLVCTPISTPGNSERFSFIFERNHCG